MSDVRRIVILIASVVAGLALLGILMESMDGAGDAAWFLWAPAALLFNPVTLVILLIILLARRKGAGQQQQQQVVVVTGGPPPPDGARMRCAKCQGLSKAEARFCGHCGVPFG